MITCGSSNAATHSDNTAKQSVTLTWTAPPVTSQTTVKFVFTIVQTIATHWVKKDAQSQVVVQPAASSSISAPSPSLTTAPTTVSSTTTTKTPSSGSTSTPTFYSGCGNSKGCFGSVDGCLTNSNCQLATSYQFSSDSKSFTITLSGTGLVSGDYMALGLSTDASMGEDLVFYCSPSINNVLVSWNQGKDNVGGVTGIQVSLVSL